MPVYIRRKPRTVVTFPPENILPRGHAWISDCGQYRYWLARNWSEGNDFMVWVMLNPSTADSEQDDPTIRRCREFAMRWGYGGMWVVNLFAKRTSDPDLLWPSQIPASESNKNLDVVRSLCTMVPNRLVVAAWGAHRMAQFGQRAVLDVLRGKELYCLGTTQEGFPRHPLYVPADRLLRVFEAAQPQEV